ncbi:MAG: hypothetical protein ACM3VW_08935, partial [Bacteroidota bacterium]
MGVASARLVPSAALGLAREPTRAAFPDSLGWPGRTGCSIGCPTGSERRHESGSEALAPGASEYDLDDERVYGFAALAVTAGVALLVGVLLGVGAMLVVPQPGVPRAAASASATATPRTTPPSPPASASARAATPRTAASGIRESHAAAQPVPPVRSGDGPFDPGQGGVPAGWVRYFSRGPASTSGGWS